MKKTVVMGIEQDYQGHGYIWSRSVAMGIEQDQGHAYVWSKTVAAAMEQDCGHGYGAGLGLLVWTKTVAMGRKTG